MNYKKLAVIGGGKMAQAIVNSAMNQVVWGDEICIANPHLGKLSLLRNQGVRLSSDNREAAAFGSVVLLAVKAPVLEGVLDELEELLPGKTVVSIVPGYSRSWLMRRLPGSHIICALPNAPLSLGKGATAITPMDNVPEKDYRFVSSLFLCCGGLFVVPEERLDAILPINGCSPAFFAVLVDIMARLAVEKGIDYNMAVMMTAQSMAGAAELLLRGGRTPEQLKLQVCAAGEATLAGVTALEGWDLHGVMDEVYRRCLQRAGEIGK